MEIEVKANVFFKKLSPTLIAKTALNSVITSDIAEGRTIKIDGTSCFSV